MKRAKADVELAKASYYEVHARFRQSTSTVTDAAGKFNLALHDLSAAAVIALKEEPFDEDGVFLADVAELADAADAAKIELLLISGSRKI